MSEKLYKIKPLKWEKIFGDYAQTWQCSVPMGSYRVERYREDGDPERPWGGWIFNYCFDEYYDESSQDCSGPEEGKEMAWKDWLERIIPALEEVK